MALSDIITNAAERAAEVRSRYFDKSDACSYRMTDFLKFILADEGILIHERKVNQAFYGWLVTDGDGSTIMVNANHYPARRRFTIAHELGHYFLHGNTGRDFVDDRRTLYEYNAHSREEMEANAFGAELLVPMPSLIQMMDRRYRFGRIANSFGASWECVKWRMVTFLRNDFHTSGSTALELAQEYIDCSKRNSLQDVRIFQYVEQNRMVSVATPSSVILVQETIDVVAVCMNGSPYMRPEVILAHTEVVWVEVTLPILLDDNQRFMQCPRCGNKDFSEDATHCKKCGLHLFNRCQNFQEYDPPNCGALNQADACFCEYCGHATYLAERKLLKPWNDDAEREAAATATKYEPDPFADDSLPDIGDDDLPF